MSLPQLILLLFLFITSTSAAQEYDKLPTQTQRAFYQLKDQVQSVKEEKWVPAADSTVFVATTKINVDSSYNMEQGLIMDFNNDGYLTRQVSSEAEGRKKNKFREQTKLLYYRDNRLQSMSNASEGRTIDSVAYHYRKKGQMDYYQLFNAKGELLSRADFVYKNGKLFSVRKKNKELFPVSTVKYFYKDDKLSETRHFDGQSRQTETKKFSNRTIDHKMNESYSVLDEKGNLKEGLLLVKDSTGRLLERSVISDERKVMEYNGYQYNPNGDVEIEKLFNASVELTITNRYTYDEQGNWTRKEIFYNGILNAVVVREIKYY